MGNSVPTFLLGGGGGTSEAEGGDARGGGGGGGCCIGVLLSDCGRVKFSEVYPNNSMDPSIG